MIHLYAFESHSGAYISSRRATCDPDFEESFLIPGADGLVTLVFTVIDYDELRNDFLGQAVLKLKGTSIWAQGGIFDMPLGFMRIAPKESNRTNMRLGCSDEGGEGTLKLEIKPLPHYNSYCGYLVSEESVTSSGGKKWWCVLAEGHLRMYLHYGEEKERHSIRLKAVPPIASKSIGEGHRTKYIMEIRCPEQLWILRSPSGVEQKHWSTRIRHIQESSSHKD